MEPFDNEETRFAPRINAVEPDYPALAAGLRRIRVRSNASVSACLVMWGSSAC